MSSSCIEEVSVPDDNWYRIANELLSRAGIAINGSAPADIRVKNPDFFKRVLQEGSLGLGESYMDGWWECDRLDMFFSKVLRAGLENQLPHHFKDTLRIAGARLFNLQSKKRAWIVGKEHYDLGNDLFSRMLDPFMQYSCAYWKDADNLESAQQAKLKMICEKLQLKPGMRVLDIGCGWGFLLIEAAKKYKIHGTGITLSHEQYAEFQRRIKEQGLEDYLTVELMDYRDLPKKEYQFDRVVSVGMLEHVGRDNYQLFLDCVEKVLKPGGLFLLHFISALKEHPGDPWVKKYIFPGGTVPSLREILNHMAEDNFHTLDIENLRLHYNKTLLHWEKNFRDNIEKEKTMFDEEFLRMWDLYLSACAATFHNGIIDLHQILMTKGINNDLPMTRWY